jgi:hypothetical protein
MSTVSDSQAQGELGTNLPLRGAHRRGPIAKPRTKSEIPRIAISVSIRKKRMTSDMPPEKAVLTKATANVAMA